VYNTTDLSFQLGVQGNSSTRVQRSVFDKQHPQLTEEIRSLSTPFDLIDTTPDVVQLLRKVTDPVNEFHTRSDNNFSIMMCTNCEYGDYGAVSDEFSSLGIYGATNNFTYIHPAYAAIFNDVLREANHPAHAIQSLSAPNDYIFNLLLQFTES
jgi:hypothetical protein